MTADKIVYYDEPGHRVLDLRPLGADCVPSLSFSDFRDVKPTIGFHYHPSCIEISLCLRGSLCFDTPDGKSFSFLPGHLFVSRPDEPHHLQSCPSGLKVYSCLFRLPKKSQKILGLDARGSEWLTRSLLHLPKRLFASTPQVRQSFERLFSVYDDQPKRSPAVRVKIRAAALDLFISVIEAARRLPQKSPEKIDEIARRIRKRPGEDYSLRTLADEARLSVSAFALAFRRANGLPLHAYLLDSRITQARQLLLTTPRTVTSIAQELHFYSTEHFARTFRRIVGVNPQQFRNSKTLRGQVPRNSNSPPPFASCDSCQ